jgi:putative ABC transport system permease protein
MLKPSFNDLLKSSFKSILKNKSRTILTSLGVIIGVTSVILLTSIGNGLKDYINQQFDAIGSNAVFIVPGKIFDDKGNIGQSSTGPSRFVSISFDNKDVSRLKKVMKNNIILTMKTTLAEIKNKNIIKKNVTLIGTTPEYGNEMNSKPEDGNGSWFNKEDINKKSNVVILGDKIASDLFPNSNPLNKKIIINSKSFKIIGIAKKKGSSLGGPSFDDYVFAPSSSINSMVGNDKFQQIIIKVKDKNQIENIKKIAKTSMSKKYEEDSFSVFDSRQLLDSINSIIGVLTIALTGIAAISLIVGGIGIMNIMLVSVTERTKEIGLRKAIGAYPRAILIQFLIEATILSCLGGLIGIILGFLGALALNPFFPAKVTISSVILAFGVSSLVGIIFGVAPAQKASKLSPIEALRYE